jgi:hypothetical protein
MNTNKKTARLAGFLYLLYIIVSIVASILRDKSVVLGDAAATAKNILSSEWLFRASFVSDLVSGLLFFLTAWALYVLLQPVNKNIALLFMLLNLAGVAIQCANLLNQFAALLLLCGADYLQVFRADQLQALAMLFLTFYKNGFWICQIFYGAWLFPLGYLVYKSGFLPRLLGIVLIIHCVGWLMTFLQFFLFPNYTGITYLTYPLGFIAEFGLSLWLLIMGAKGQKTASLEAIG